MSAYFTAQQAAFRLSQSNSAYISQMLAAAKGRDLTTTIALAMVVCKLTPLPGGVVESPESFFNENGGVSGAEAIGVLNNLVPVDYKGALEIGRNLYLVRYELATCPFNAFGYDRSKGIASVFGLNAHLSKDVLNCIRENGQEITTKYEKFLEIVNQLKKD